MPTMEGSKSLIQLVFEQIQDMVGSLQGVNVTEEVMMNSWWPESPAEEQSTVNEGPQIAPEVTSSWSTQM